VLPYYVNQYQLYQAERVKSEAARRQADAERGMRAAARARRWQDLTRLVRGLRHRGRDRRACLPCPAPGSRPPA
jgi:hypothetical protein